MSSITTICFQFNIKSLLILTAFIAVIGAWKHDRRNLEKQLLVKHQGVTGFSLQSSVASEVSETLKTLFPSASIVIDNDDNLVLVVDAEKNVEAMKQIVRELEQRPR